MNSTWTLDRINQMITDGIEESNQLDYKGAGALAKTDRKRNEISKDVSAFANSNGGVIIYGVREFDDKDNSHLPEKIDAIKRTDITKEWLEQIISTKIQPKIDGIEITPIEVSKENNTVIYIVDIPKSNTAHQASGHKYYKRYNFESVAMEDYEIRDVMSRGAYPNMTLEFEIERRELVNSFVPTMGGLNQKEWGNFLRIRIRNKGSVFANYVNYYITINKFIISDRLQKDFKTVKTKDSGAEYIEYYGENTIRDVVDWEGMHEKYGPSRFDPILPGMKSRPEVVQLTDGDLKPFFKEEISWVIYADNALPKHGTIAVSDIKNIKGL